jgi:hypothetical protein
MAISVIYLYGDILHYTKINSKGIKNNAGLAVWERKTSDRAGKLGKLGTLPE